MAMKGNTIASRTQCTERALSVYLNNKHYTAQKSTYCCLLFGIFPDLRNARSATVKPILDNRNAVVALSEKILGFGRT